MPRMRRRRPSSWPSASWNPSETRNDSADGSSRSSHARASRVARRAARRPVHVKDVEVLEPLSMPDDDGPDPDGPGLREAIREAIEALPERYPPRGGAAVRTGHGCQIDRHDARHAAGYRRESDVSRANRLLRTRLHQPGEVMSRPEGPRTDRPPPRRRPDARRGRAPGAPHPYLPGLGTGGTGRQRTWHAWSARDSATVRPRPTPSRRRSIVV